MKFKLIKIIKLSKLKNDLEQRRIKSILFFKEFKMKFVFNSTLLFFSRYHINFIEVNRNPAIYFVLTKKVDSTWIKRMGVFFRGEGKHVFFVQNFF